MPRRRTAPEGPASFADRLNRLYATVHPAGRDPYSNAEVATAIRAGGEQISEAYLWQLRTGRKDNPTLKHLQAIARFFDVPVAYFVDETIGERLDAELEILAAMRDRRIRDVALRALHAPPETLEPIADLLDRLSRTGPTQSPAQPTPPPVRRRHPPRPSDPTRGQPGRPPRSL